jgi:hypothetical protein
VVKEELWPPTRTNRGAVEEELWRSTRINREAVVVVVELLLFRSGPLRTGTI